MDCGPHVQQCGVLSIDTGLGFYGGLFGWNCPNATFPTGCTDQTHPPYAQPLAKVHGLWFETPPYGNSQCLNSTDWETACEDQSWVFAPAAYCEEQTCDNGIPTCYSMKEIPPCYDGYQGAFAPGAEGELQRRYMLWFVNHEWRKHGTCGWQNATDFFAQVCQLVAPLTSAIDRYRMQGLSDYTQIRTIACKLFAEFEFVEVSSHAPNTHGTSGEISVSACLNSKKGRWQVVPVSQFDEACGDPSYLRPPREFSRPQREKR